MFPRIGNKRKPFSCQSHNIITNWCSQISVITEILKPNKTQISYGVQVFFFFRGVIDLLRVH